MLVYLIEDLQGIGKKYDLVDVNPTYALNVLFPKRMAMAQTPSTDERFAHLSQNNAHAEPTTGHEVP